MERQIIAMVVLSHSYYTDTQIAMYKIMDPLFNNLQSSKYLIRGIFVTEDYHGNDLSFHICVSV
jgi:Ni,Fe-hydrogenase III large subunit